MDPQLVIFGTALGGSILIQVGTEFLSYLKEKQERKEAESWTKARGTTDIVLSPEHTDEDRAWVTSMLERVDSKIPVKILCHCGFATECAMHCNHGVHPDCKGDSYFKLNDIETKKEKPRGHTVLPPPKPKKSIPPPPPRGPGAGSRGHVPTQEELRKAIEQMRIRTEKKNAEKARFNKQQAMKEIRAKVAAERAKFGEQLELPFEKPRSLDEIMAEVTRLEKELRRLQSMPMPITGSPTVVTEKVWNPYTEREEIRLIDGLRARLYTNNSGPR